MDTKEFVSSSEAGGSSPAPIESDKTIPTGAKSKNAEKNEAKKQAKLAKFAAKQAKLSATIKAAEGEKKKEKEKKPKVEKATKSEIFIDNTPLGEKKDMSNIMASSYNPKAVEAAWYAWWEKQGFFKPELTPDGKPNPEGLFVVPAPPPNVTGSLHIGHGLTVAIQDALCRWNRMLGKTVLFNPGIDHAGISTQSVVEKKLWKEKKQTRHDLGREAFVNEIWKWKNKYGDHIHSQLKRLGGSYEWERNVFTMDEKQNRAVVETFCRLQEEGIIYRSTRLINWCVRLNTSLSNLEVENKDISGCTLMSVPGYDPEEKFEFGVLTSFGYIIENSDERIVVATTRPETMLGDTGIAIHPKDERYKHLHGKFAIHPFNGRRLPIVLDDIIVDMAFGTGAVKITPAHDFNDYEVGKRHNLEFINILNDDGTLNANGAPFQGMKRFHVRKAVVDALKDKGLYVETIENPMTVPICSKSGDVIEPLLKPQWWVSCSDMAKDAMKAVEEGKMHIFPKASEKEWFRWLGNIQDWCISRQLWWGHQVPAYFIKIPNQDQDPADGNFWISGHNLEIAHEKAKQKFPNVDFTLEQDPDVLDTWFSSGLWPFSIFGWPNNTQDLKTFYPTSLLETGWDILFFWVARMVMLGIKLTGQVPFEEVFCHAMIRDAHGRKMSKSLGNVIDPVDVIQGITLEKLHSKLYEGNLDKREIERAIAGQKADFPNGIPECGTDALRFALCAYSSGGRDINLDILRVEGYRKFCNKLWNATRFALMKLGDDFKPRENGKKTGKESLTEQWVLHKLNQSTIETNKALHERNFMVATTAVYNFWLHEFCDIYIELIKPLTDADTSITENVERKRSAQDTLYTCLESGLKLLHPFMPFVTEELYQRLPRRPGDNIPTIVKARYPVADSGYHNPQAEERFELVFSVIKAARSITAEYNIQSNASLFIQTVSETTASFLKSQEQSITTLVKSAKSVHVFQKGETIPSGCALSTVNDDVNVLLMVKGFVDIDAEVLKFQNKLDKTNQLLTSLQKRTSTLDYENKVPANVKEADEIRLKAYQAEIDALSLSIQNFLKLEDK
ncbi:274_t:CDS:10 [Funneliformis mosseae]|uniref:Probable valine--tRNA ligase, cytoplasmic n=1 Tax=Funneliformis mosseae TaxID=27381 RepID=A0A9N9FXT9_FUNMO|nr:274_t:CDS:10 [Funneliformis mosseae]